MSIAAERTPDERFADLPGWPHEPSYREWEGLRLAYYDLGPRDGQVVMLFHGEPTWSFMYRATIAPLLAAGYRCVLQDQPGFGRSDKPTDVGWYDYDRHAAAAVSLLDELDLSDVCVVVHDWGGPIGLRCATERPERVSRIVITDTGLFTGQQRMTDAWNAFRDFVERTEDLPVAFLVDGATKRALSDAEKAAYDAPYATPASKAGARAFPLMIPLAPDGKGAEAGQRVLAALAADKRPLLMLWADEDPVLTLETGRRFAAAIGYDGEPETISGASHFLHEDAGAVIGARVAQWLTSG